MRLTSRDEHVLLSVGSYRILSSEQIEALHFASPTPRGRRTSCQRRLQLLFHHRFLDRLFLPVVLGEGRRPYVYSLAERGAALVAALTGTDKTKLYRPKRTNQVGADFVSHRLAITGFRVALNLLADKSTLGLGEWLDEDVFRTADMKNRVPIRMRGARIVRNYPDGYFTARIPGESREAHFFLEVDMGTMSYTRWREKIKAYTEFRERGLSARHFGTRNFRLLVLTTSAPRLEGLKQATEDAGGTRRFWFTTLDMVDVWQPEHLLEPIWFPATEKDGQQLFPQVTPLLDNLRS